MSKLKDIINMPYERLIELTKKENIEYFKSVVKYLSEESNKRINTLLNSPIGKYSPAYKKLKDAGITRFETDWIDKIKSTSKSRKNSKTLPTSRLLEQYSNTKKFLQAKTSKLSGWQDVRAKIKKRTNSKKLFSRDYKSKRSASYWLKKEDQFWKLYNRLVDEYGGVITELNSTRIQKMLARIQKIRNVSKDEDLIQSTMETYIDELYKSKRKHRRLSDDKFEEEFRLQFKKSRK